MIVSSFLSSSEPGCIVAGTDFSARAARAGDAAAALAVRLGMPLRLVHSLGETLREEMPQGARDALTPILLERLRMEAGRLRQSGATVDEALLAGVPDEGINDFARRWNARLIFFGYPALGMLNRWLTGSVSEVIAESSQVPTLLVRAPEPLEDWARGEKALHVFIATDLTPESDAALRWVADLRTLGPCEITLGCVDRASGLAAGTPDSAQTLIRELRNRAKQFLGIEPAVRIAPGVAPVEAQLLQLAGELHADLLVTGTHQRHGFDRLWHHSVSRGLLRHSTISVACVPPVMEAAHLPVASFTAPS
jgi:nucleotide-binding universal stress UspA family protein